MSFTGANTLLALIILSLGGLGVILSFLVTDQKKNMIALGIAGFILLLGLFQFGSQWISRVRWERRMSQMRQESNFDWNKVKEGMKPEAGQKKAAPAAQTAK
ncbi:MAG: hypothetical protein LHV69_08990 [Elusimicrobia bacterium]|nr:hypothetical protein [Candidatus Obscuribacterium magneticum]